MTQAITHRTAMTALRAYIVDEYSGVFSGKTPEAHIMRSTVSKVLAKIDALEAEIKLLKSDSGYKRQASDLYETPAWVTRAVVEWMEGASLLVKNDGPVWECAAGNHKMARELQMCGYSTLCSDINPAPRGMVNIMHDMVAGKDNPPYGPNDAQAIITNPPYDRKIVDKFVDACLECNDVVALLLPVNFDSAKGRHRLFAGNSRFRAKLPLTSRIRWFDDDGPGPMKNHAFYIWGPSSPLPPIVCQIPFRGGFAEAMEARARADKKKRKPKIDKSI